MPVPLFPTNKQPGGEGAAQGKAWTTFLPRGQWERRMCLHKSVALGAVLFGLFFHEFQSRLFVKQVVPVSADSYKVHIQPKFMFCAFA